MSNVTDAQSPAQPPPHGSESSPHAPHTHLVADDASATIRSSATRALSKATLEDDRKASVDALTQTSIMPKNTLIKWAPRERFRKRLLHSGSVYHHDQVR